MKQLLLVLIAAVTIVAMSCSKASKTTLAPKKMNGIEFTKKYKFELPFLDYSTGSAVARGKKAKADAVSLSVFNDLTITNLGGDVVETTLSPNAEWAGVQKWITVDTSNNATSLCNWNWSNSTAPATIQCIGAVTGFSYRSWSSDKVTYDVHLSAFLPL